MTEASESECWQPAPEEAMQLQGHQQGTHLQGLVVPAIRAIQAAASAMKELERPVSVTELPSPRNIQAYQANAALNHVQGVPVGGVCRTGESVASGLRHPQSPTRRRQTTCLGRTLRSDVLS